MSSRIQQLDTHVVNRIAAGEVVERPASVVKELLENSVDALATRIEIDIEAGGQELIRISDNGEGIHADDLPLAVTSHATSKIRSDADLDRVATLGFRGEALASIAAVSRFRIRTRPPGEPTGRELESSGGDCSGAKECGCPEGTTIEVRNLFFNTPARRRILRKPSSEFGRISDQFARIALVNPRLHLVLRHNGRIVHDVPASANQEDRIRRFFGSEVADKLIPVESSVTSADGDTTRLWGFVGQPSLSKATRQTQFLFLNGRWIQDRSLQHALGEAYRGLLMTGRHPVSFLFLELPPHQVDVNVHPTKTEVRFRDGQAIYRQLLKTIRDRFHQLDFHAEFQAPAAVGVPRMTEQALAVGPSLQELNVWAATATSVAPPTIQPASFPPSGHSAERDWRPEPFDDSLVDSPRVEDPGIDPFGRSSSESEAAVTEPTEADELSVLPANSSAQGFRPEIDFRAIQVHDCYLVVAGDDGLEIIDQHALHERILYEHFRRRIMAGQVERQRLLVPQPVECSPVEAAVLCEHRELLREIGFEIQEFGGSTVLLESHPVLIPRGNFVRILKDLAEQLDQSGGRTSRRDLLERLLQTMACRAAIKAGQRLTPEEMQELLRQRRLVEDSHHCPHGRPTSMKLSRGMLDRQFGRLG